MHTSFMYQALGLRDQECTRTRYEDNMIKLEIKTREDKLRCAHCGSRHVVHDGKTEREFRCVPIGSKPIVLVKTVFRLKCKDCGKELDEPIHFSTGKRRYTHKFERYVCELSSVMTIKDVATLLRVSWDTVKDIQKRYLYRRYNCPDLSGLKHIGIDEFAVQKGHVYKTIVVNLDNGQIMFVGDGKGSDSLKKFWKRLKKSGAKIEAVATDLSAAYISAVKENLPDAVQVYDHFHVIKLMNDTLDQIRRNAYARAKDEDKDFIKGTRWLLLMNGERLKDSEKAQAKLREALQMNMPLMKAYYLKEGLHEIWNRALKPEAEVLINEWIAQAKATKVRLLRKMAETVEKHRTGILAWYDFSISTGKLEGINNKIKVLKRKAYGYRDDKFFELKLLSLHDPIYAFAG